MDALAASDVREETQERIGRLSQEFINAREVYWHTQMRRVWGGCGDDRGITEQSARDLEERSPETLSPIESYASIYGGAAGAAKNILIVGIVQYGPAFVEKVGGFEGMLEKTVRLMGTDTSDQAILPLLHSADGNENPDGTFCMHGNTPTGCAYCGGVGATSALLVDKTKPLTRNTAREDQAYIFGSDQYVDALLDAHTAFLQTATNGEEDAFAVGREDYIKQIENDTPVMILAGKHAGAKGTGVIHNFVLGTIGSANQANSDGKGFYREDIAQYTAAVLRNFPEFGLDPEILMRAFVLDSTPVRSVLAAHDADPELAGELDPRNLAMGFRGDPKAAIEALRRTA